ncbi:hypothetical protein KT99_04054 [Shewanella benthica KT99]|uniref:Uncharacterized protein n=1 Tax=Shewanella benthica KT99 TaxID=314608 RepID=A9D205_9GAMM|nr:hypothetical protein KT99_04054 [Shewanella benthica KT99]
MDVPNLKHCALLLTLATSLLLTACSDNDKDDNNDSQEKIAVQVGPRPLFLVRQIQDGELIPSEYANAANDAGLKIIT